jgi:hypothetical protein
MAGRKRVEEEEEETAPSCRCRTGCENRRCACLKGKKACGDECACTGCRNPLQGVDVASLSGCAIANIAQVKALTEQDRKLVLELPCGDAKVELGNVLGGYECRKCKEEYWYSFCWGDVVQQGDTWHCDACGTCRDWREWHCAKCNRCTYGVTMPCDYCGRRGKYSMGFDLDL